jgi:hypothetical protein
MSAQEQLRLYMNALWHGLSPAVITLATAVAVVAQDSKRMPVDYEWVYILAGFATAFISGVNSFIAEPK